MQPATDHADSALSQLQQVWMADGHPANSFAEFESALVREGLRLRRQRVRLN
jgi:hypothetical protein